MRRRSLLRRPPALALEAFDQPQTEVRLDASQLDLAHGIQRLPRDLGEVVTLRFLHGLTADETASVLNVPVPTVKSRQLRALTQLRKWLGPESAKEVGTRHRAPVGGR
jgi:RNA polymerase sigma-70 factor (ECF subfamily)